jgi:outer membrane protein assembly factor BamB
VASNDDSSSTLIRYDSLVGFSATKDTVYYLKVDAASGEGGEFLLTISDALWQALAMIAGMTTPAVAADGTIYYVDIWGILYAFQTDGTKKWVFTDTEDTVTGGGPAVAADGTICFGDDSGAVFAVRPDGTKKWSFTTGGAVWTAAAIGADGTFYVKSDDGYLYALAADGTKKWTYPVPGETYSAPAVAPDGTIYIAASGDKALYALTPGGSRKWRFDMGAETYASPALGSDGVLYVGNYDGRFFAIKPDGTEKWHFDTKSPLSASAVLDSRGNVYFGSYDTKLYALDAVTGAEKWEYATGDVIRGTAPVVGSDGTIFIGGDDGLVHAVSGEGKRLRTYAVGSGVYGAPALVGGRLYVPTYDAKIFAFGVTMDAASSPWPMHRHNVRRLGRAVDLGGVPNITAQPVPATAKAGQSVTFSVTAMVRNGQALAYQWQFNNAPISGATNASYTIPSVTAANAGAYSVIVTGSAGSTPSASATLTVDSGTSPSSTQLVNFSLRGFAGTSDRTLIVGFNADGPGSKKVYVRGVGGEKLASFGVASPLADPTIQVLQMLSASSVVVTSNDNWSGDDCRSAGGFELTAGSKDAVVSRGFPAGTYTAQLTGVGGGTGEAMVELYDGAQSDTANRLTNVSARTQLDTDQRLIVGFCTVGAAKRVVIRGIGPKLSEFGVGTAHADPRIELYDGSGRKIAENDNWSGDDGHDIGGFQLTAGSKDAVIARTLDQGNYYVHVLSAPGTSGVVLVEAYLAP